MKRGVCREGDFLQIRILSEKLCLASISALSQVKRKYKEKKKKTVQITMQINTYGID